ERVHWASGLMVGISGVASAFFVICANAWMNSPAGFDWNGGNPINIDPWKAMFNEAAFLQGLHMVVAAFEAVGFAVAGLHALLFLKTRLPIHLSALKIAFVFAAVAALVQPLVGDFSAKSVARRQPVKLAAMEGHFYTERGASLLLGGLPDVKTKTTPYAIHLPKLLSFLAHGDFNSEVKGLSEFPRNEWPPVLIVHLAFQVMVGLGSWLALLGALGLWGFWKRPNWVNSLGFYRVIALSLPLGFVALEAGWVVTEVGRQPWIIYGILRTADAVTSRPDVGYTLGLYAVLYVFLTFVVALLLKRQMRLLEIQSTQKEATP
ncbi:MAG: cytochrome ubiquinol oxidase subunit I, partial [Proteobacteria bacterium]